MPATCDAGTGAVRTLPRTVGGLAAVELRREHEAEWLDRAGEIEAGLGEDPGEELNALDRRHLLTVSDPAASVRSPFRRRRQPPRQRGVYTPCIRHVIARCGNVSGEVCALPRAGGWWW